MRNKILFGLLWASALIIIISVFAAAQWEYGGKVIVGYDWFTYYKSFCLSDDNGVVITWEDERAPSNPDIYAQKVDSAGYELWPANGVLVCNSFSGQYVPFVASDGAGGAIFAWWDIGRTYPYSYDVYAQHLDPFGNYLWSDTGIVVRNTTNHETVDAVVADGRGGAIIMWNSPAVVQRVDSIGNLLFGPEGLRLTQTSYSQVWGQLTMTTDSNFVAVWHDERQGYYAQKFTLEGEILWGPDGAPVTVEPSEPSSNQFHICPSSNGGLFAIWRDYNHDLAISLQWLDMGGEARWGPTGMVIESGIYPGGPQITASWDGRAIIAWAHPGDWLYDIHANIIDTLGVREWPQNMVLCDSVSYSFGITSSAPGEFEIAFAKSYLEKILKCSIDNGFVWGDTGICFTCPGCPTSDISLISDGEGGAYFGWKRAEDNSVVLNRVYREGWVAPDAINEDQETVPKTVGISAYPNPFNSSVNIRCNFNNQKGGEIGIYDIQGKLVKAFKLEGDVDGKINWDATDAYGEKVSCGIYFVKAKTSQSSQAIKLIYLK